MAADAQQSPQAVREGYVKAGVSFTVDAQRQDTPEVEIRTQLQQMGLTEPEIVQSFEQAGARRQSSSGGWYYQLNGDTAPNPVSEERLMELYREGTVTDTTYVWNASKGMKEWQTIFDVGILPKNAWYFNDGLNTNGPMPADQLRAELATTKVNWNSIQVWNGSTVKDWTRIKQVPEFQKEAPPARRPAGPPPPLVAVLPATVASPSQGRRSTRRISSYYLQQNPLTQKPEFIDRDTNLPEPIPDENAEYEEGLSYENFEEPSTSPSQSPDVARAPDGLPAVHAPSPTPKPTLAADESMVPTSPFSGLSISTREHGPEQHTPTTSGAGPADGKAAFPAVPDTDEKRPERTTLVALASDSSQSCSRPDRPTRTSQSWSALKDAVFFENNEWGERIEDQFGGSYVLKKGGRLQFRRNNRWYSANMESCNSLFAQVSYLYQNNMQSTKITRAAMGKKLRAVKRFKIDPGWETKTILEHFKEENPSCADCSCKDPTWAILPWGVLVCDKCSGVHRGLKGQPKPGLDQVPVDAVVWNEGDEKPDPIVDGEFPKPLKLTYDGHFRSAIAAKVTHNGTTLALQIPHVCQIRSVTIDEWDETLWKNRLDNFTGNDFANQGLEYRVDKDMKKPAWNTPRPERTTYIRNKYLVASFSRETFAGRQKQPERLRSGASLRSIPPQMDLTIYTPRATSAPRHAGSIQTDGILRVRARFLFNLNARAEEAPDETRPRAGTVRKAKDMFDKAKNRAKDALGFHSKKNYKPYLILRNNDHESGGQMCRTQKGTTEDGQVYKFDEVMQLSIALDRPIGISMYKSKLGRDRLTPLGGAGSTLARWHSLRKQESYARKSQKSRVKAMLLSGAIEKVAHNESILEILRSDADESEISDYEPSSSSFAIGSERATLARRRSQRKQEIYARKSEKSRGRPGCTVKCCSELRPNIKKLYFIYVEETPVVRAATSA